MISRRQRRWTWVVTAMCSLPLTAFAQHVESFRAVLESSELGPEVLAKLSDGPDYSHDDWKTLLQIFNRLEQFYDLQPTARPISELPERWQAGGQADLGKLFELRGRIVAVTRRVLPNAFSEFHDWPGIYRCKLEFSTEGQSSFAWILTTRIPNLWQGKQTLSEPVRIRGMLLQILPTDRGSLPVFLTTHIAWYPTAEAPTGLLLLARGGMDVSLLDEVRHRKPFVKPEVSREGEAFYAALKAVSKTNREEISQLAKQNVARVAEAWRDKQPDLRRAHQKLEARLQSSTDDADRSKIQRQIKPAKQQRALAAAVLSKAESGQSSVAPMFLQPEQEVGQLMLIEGIARRAVQIAVADDAEMEAYYEVEVFTTDSQNLPIVCCLGQLPAGFPTGDQILEPVRLSGIFFKSWRYRSRGLATPPGETARQRQLYTPVMIGKEPRWLSKASSRDNRWAFFGGIVFLSVLALLWITLTWLAWRDRQARAGMRKQETINL